jgi:hypothetical protein
MMILGLGAAVLVTLATSGLGRQDAQTAPASAASAATPQPPAPVLSGNLPLTVNIPSGVSTPEQARPFFDSFSWQEFIALNWPAAKSPRGTPNQPNDPDTFLKAANGTQVVWGTYKPDYELFSLPASQRPSDWNAANAPVGLCKNAQPGQKVFVRYSKGDSVLEVQNQAFSYPLIDQNKNYAVYEIAFNQAQYNFIRGADSDPTSWLYLVKNLAAKEPIMMPASSAPANQGALMVKAAWRILDPKKDKASRFYAVTAAVYDPQTQKCAPQKVGLVGFHVVQKLAAFQEWIWSTFEQVDNVPGTTPGTTSGPYSFNNGTAKPETVGGYADRPPYQAPKLQPKSQRKPVQVTRLNAIPDSTAALNKTYQALMGKTVWQYYQLVFTQWPTHPSQFKTMEAGGIYPQDSGAAFPVNGVTNAVMETYFQSQNDAAGAGGNSCMSCHYRAGQADYSWTLLRDAH